jgi:hypothetical protein
MNDPRLNSVHLEFPRRDDFRRARSGLLDSRGQQTVALDGHLAGTERRNPLIDPAQASDEQADHWLVDQGTVYPLKIGVNTIGRLSDNDVVVESPYISRRHCAILVHAGESCELYDIASKNGTFINGAKLDGPTRLHCGDEIRMCDRNMVFMSKRLRKDETLHGKTDVDDE